MYCTCINKREGTRWTETRLTSLDTKITVHVLISEAYSLHVYRRNERALNEVPLFIIGLLEICSIGTYQLLTHIGKFYQDVNYIVTKRPQV